MQVAPCEAGGPFGSKQNGERRQDEHADQAAMPCVAGSGTAPARPVAISRSSSDSLMAGVSPGLGRARAAVSTAALL